MVKLVITMKMTTRMLLMWVIWGKVVWGRKPVNPSWSTNTVEGIRRPSSNSLSFSKIKYKFSSFPPSLFISAVMYYHITTCSKTKFNNNKKVLFDDHFEESLFLYLMFSRTRSIQYQTFPIAVLPEKNAWFFIFQYHCFLFQRVNGGSMGIAEIAVLPDNLILLVKEIQTPAG